MNKKEGAGRTNLKNTDASSEKKKKNEWKERSRTNQREENYNKVKECQNKEKASSRKRKRDEDPQKELENNRKLLQQHRNALTAEARLKQFQQAVMYGPIFICICCHIKMFKSNVREFTKAVISQFEEKIPLERCIADMNVVS